MYVKTVANVIESPGYQVISCHHHLLTDLTVHLLFVVGHQNLQQSRQVINLAVSFSD